MIRVLLRKLSELQVPMNNQVVKRLEILSGLKKFTLEECKNEVLSNWKNKKLTFLSGIRVSEQELEMLIKVVDCLKPEELKEDHIPFPARKEICKVLGVDMWEVTKFIILQNTHKKMHEYLIGRMMRQESLPRTEDEIKKMILRDPMPNTKTSRFIKKRRDKYSSKQIKYGQDKKYNK